MKSLFKEISNEERNRILEMHFKNRKTLNEELEVSSVGDKIEQIIEKPRFENHFEKIVSSLTPEQEQELNNILDNLGITADSDLNDVHSEIEDKMSEIRTDIEMTEEENENPNETAKQKVANILNELGAANIKAWGGVPAAIAIGMSTGMPLGFAISWGVTGLLMGLAKAMDKTGRL